MPEVCELDALPAAQATELLRSCCGASRWVSAMVARRPFGSREAILAAADEIWRGLSPADWQEAFRHHPRIGERTGAIAQTSRSQRWSAAEQSSVSDAADSVRRQLTVANREYERRFGHVFIVNATGKSAGEMLALARTRLANSPELELQIAAGEQQQITRHRLRTLLDDGRSGGGAG